jgi:hypothetical protein
MSLIISCVLLYVCAYSSYNYFQGVRSMNTILDTYNIYYKNKFSYTYLILEKQDKKLLKDIVKYNWNIDGVRELTKDKMIIYLNPSCGQIAKLSEFVNLDNYNLIYIKDVEK